MKRHTYRLRRSTHHASDSCNPPASPLSEGCSRRRWRRNLQGRSGESVSYLRSCSHPFTCNEVLERRQIVVVIQVGDEPRTAAWSLSKLLQNVLEGRCFPHVYSPAADVLTGMPTPRWAEHLNWQMSASAIKAGWKSSLLTAQEVSQALKVLKCCGSGLKLLSWQSGKSKVISSKESD